jgi:hypothetical protein
MCGKRGDVVYQRNRWGVQIHYPYHKPKNPKTPKQMFVRKMWAITAFTWRIITEEQRQAWQVRGKSQKSRRRLGQSWPLKGFYYYMRENASLAYRGQPLLDRPPVEDRKPPSELPLLTRTLSDAALQMLITPVQALPASPGPAPPSGA